MATKELLNEIQIRRTKLPITDPKVVGEPEFKFGEPLYVDLGTNENNTSEGGYLIIGPQDEVTGENRNINNLQVIRTTPRVIKDPEDSLDKKIPVADNDIFYKNKDQSSNIATLMTSKGNTIYPRTTISAISSDDSIGLAELLANKVDVDNNSITHTSLGFDEKGVYIDEFDPKKSDLLKRNPDLLNILNKKVSHDDNTLDRDLTLGRDFLGTYVHTSLSDEDNYIKSYIKAEVDRLVKYRLLAVEGDISDIYLKLGSVSGVEVNENPPENKNVLWIDINNSRIQAGTNGLKYRAFNEFEEEINNWVHVPVGYTASTSN